jgi:hypothetical protein
MHGQRLMLNLVRFHRGLHAGGKWIRMLGPAKTGDHFEPALSLRKKLVLLAEEIRAETFAVDASDPRPCRAPSEAVGEGDV